MENLCLVKLKMFMRYPRGERDQLSSKDVLFSCGVDIIWEVKNYWRAHVIPESALLLPAAGVCSSLICSDTVVTKQRPSLLLGP